MDVASTRPRRHNPDPAMNLLASAIGYDLHRPIRLALRLDTGTSAVPSDFDVVSATDGARIPVAFTPWGERWGAAWALATLPPLAAGTYRVERNGRPAGDGLGEPVVFDVGPNLLVARTLEWVGPWQAEVRQRFCRTKPGWRDCGSWLQEANSHAVYLWGMFEVLERTGGRLDAGLRERLLRQTGVGLACLAAYQDAARAAGKGDGALIHEPNAQPDLVIRNDAIKAALAFARAGTLVPDGAAWTARARAAAAWAAEAPPFQPEKLEPRAHGAPAGYRPPGDGWQTCDLFLLAHVHLELARRDPDPLGAARPWLDRALARQVPASAPEHGFHGHFHAFEDRLFTEKAWTHHGISFDTGQTFNPWLFPLVEALRRHPRDADAPRWRAALHSFTTGYLLPACEANPFLICPEGVFAGEGLLEFAGLWHGMNTVYAATAALALDLAEVFPELATRLEAVATGNLQWIAGLHAGITRASLAGSHMFRMDIPEGAAVPASMIHGIGRRWAGSWTTIQGSITNGFSVGNQFRFDTEPTRANDAPTAFNDEEWITHAGAWLAALARLDAVPAD